MSTISSLKQYDDPNYTVLRETRYQGVQGPASLTDFAHFFSRNKVLVRCVIARLKSAASAAGGSLHVARSAVTIASKVLTSATSAGSLQIFTLASLNTLHTITEMMSLRVSGAADKGKWDVIYEYDILPFATKLGT